MASDSISSILSGGLLDASAPDYGRIAKKGERQRKGLITLGTEQINSIFGGGTSPFYGKPSKTHFTRGEWASARPEDRSFYRVGKGGKIVPYFVTPSREPTRGAQHGAEQGAAYGSIVPGLGTVVGASAGGIVGGLSEGDYKGAGLSAATGGGWPLAQSLFGFGNSDPKSTRQVINAKLKQGLLFGSPEYQTFEGFQDPFFEKRARDYVNFALPQLSEQYQDANQATRFGLANRGLGSSTVAGQALSRLEREVGRGRQNIADTGLQQANQLRKDVEMSRQQALSQLNQSADPAQAVSSALRSAQEFQRPSVFQPITNIFSNLAQQYATSELLKGYRTPYGAPSEGAEVYTAPV